MRKKALALVRHNDTFCAVGFTATGRQLINIELHKNKEPAELKEFFRDSRYAVSLSESSSFMVLLQFPFSGREKIGLVIDHELDSILPADAEDLTMDFQEIGKGNVLSVSIQNSALEDFKDDKNINLITTNSLSALHALRWLNIIREPDYTFLNIDGSIVSVMTFIGGQLRYVRQFFYFPESDSLMEALEDLFGRKELGHAPVYMVDNRPGAAAEKERIERAFARSVEMPSVEPYTGADRGYEWLWSGIGAALLSSNPKDEINFAAGRKRRSLSINRSMFISSGAIAALCLLIFSLFYFNYHMKLRVFSFLAGEQTRVYRSAFPRAAPVKDIGKAFENRVKGIDRELHGVGVDLQATPLQILAEISNGIDDEIDVKLNEFVCDDKEFGITGTTTSFASVEKIKSSLEKIKEIKEVDIQSVDIMVGRQVRFKIRGQL